MIRTQELLAARRVDSAEQFFTRARDFGYSKTPAETLSIWDQMPCWKTRWVDSQVPSRCVIITRFPTQGLDTYWHHTASAMLAEEAFAAAADPNFAKQQLADKFLFARRGVSVESITVAQSGREDLSKFLKLDVGSYNPVLGVSYGELASESRSMHKSQGFGSAKQGAVQVQNTFAASSQIGKSKLPASLFEGIDLSWNRVAGGDRCAVVGEDQRRSICDDRKRRFPSFAGTQRTFLRLPDSPWKQPKLREIEDIIVACAGPGRSECVDHAIPTEGE